MQPSRETGTWLSQGGRVGGTAELCLALLRESSARRDTPSSPGAPARANSLSPTSHSNSCSAEWLLLLLRKAELGSCHAHRAVWMGQGTVCV